MTTVNHTAADKILEVKFSEEVLNPWQRINDCLPGKSLDDVMANYEALLHDIGLIDSSGIEVPSNSGERVGLNGAGRGSAGGKGKRTQKKGKSWTPEEHRLFLRGLEKYGKGDWRSISREFVTTRQPSQIASHAQKYFNRLKLEEKDKKRSSIHDIKLEASPQRYDISSIVNPGISNIVNPADNSSPPQICNIVNPQRYGISNIVNPADDSSPPQICNIPIIANWSFPQISNIPSPAIYSSFPQTSNISNIAGPSHANCSTVPLMPSNYNWVNAVSCFPQCPSSTGAVNFVNVPMTSHPYFLDFNSRRVT